MPSEGELVEFSKNVYKFMQVSFNIQLKMVYTVFLRVHGTSGKQHREYGNFTA